MLSVLVLHHRQRRQVVALFLGHIIVTALTAFVFFWFEVLELLSLLKHLVDTGHGLSLLLNDVFQHVELIVILSREVNSCCFLLEELLFEDADKGEFVLLYLVLLVLLLLFEEADSRERDRHVSFALLKVLEELHDCSAYSVLHFIELFLI